jgi:hypothetical protein
VIIFIQFSPDNSKDNLKNLQIKFSNVTNYTAKTSTVELLSIICEGTAKNKRMNAGKR